MGSVTQFSLPCMCNGARPHPDRLPGRNISRDAVPERHTANWIKDEQMTPAFNLIFSLSLKPQQWMSDVEYAERETMTHTVCCSLLSKTHTHSKE